MGNSKIRLGLFGKVMMAMVIGIVLGFMLPECCVRALKTFEVFVTVLLKFLVPLVILGLVTSAIVEAGKSSGKMLLATFVFVVISVVASGYFALASSVSVYPSVLPQKLSDDFAALTAVTPYFKIAIPPPMDIMTTLALAIVGGLAIVFTKSETLTKVALDGKACVSWIIGHIIVPVLPWYIFAMMAGMTVGGKIVSLLVVFICMILVSWAVTIAYLVLMYCVTGAYARKNPLKALWGMRSAYLTAFATCSSAASIPVSLENVKELGVRNEVAEMVVPLCATVHLAGSMIKLVCCASAFILLSGRSVEVGTMSVFIFMMTVTAIAAPGVPGGVITSSLGALASILLLTPEQCSMMMTVYLAMDGVGSACSVGGHGAIALAVDRVTAAGLLSKKHFAVFVCVFLSLAAAAAPVRTAVFVGDGPRGRGCVEWLRLVNASPELELKLVDSEMVRQGALAEVEVLVMPGGASVVEKRDLGPEGAAKIKDFIQVGGGYIGTCAGCCLMLDEKDDPDRGIGVTPYRRIGSKGGFMMPVSVNAAGAKALGIPEGTYPVRYHAGPILVPSTNTIEGARFETWATFDSDFDCPKSELRMYGKIAMVGGTYGKGRVFSIACHPEANASSYDLVKGAFRYVLGREVTFPTRIRRPKALTVGMFASGISGIETAQTILALDGLEGVDFFPLTSDEICGNWLDRVDYLILPDGNRRFYEKKLVGRTKELVETYAAAGGKILAWGCGAEFAPAETTVFASGGSLVEYVRRKGTTADAAESPIGVFDSGVGGLTVLEQLLSLDRINNVSGELGSDGIPDLQGESFVQLADMANLHYGSYAKSGPSGCAFLRELAIRDALFLLSGGYFQSASEKIPSGRKPSAKIIVVACNTATAYGLAGIETTLASIASPVKVVGVVNAGSRSALARCGAGPDSKPFAIGVLSTPGTDMSGIYPKTIATEALRCGMKEPPRVVTRGCVDLADAIQFGKPEASEIARRYFRELVEELQKSASTAKLKAVVFGCTHYPIMRKAFESALQEVREDSILSPYVDSSFAFVDPAVETAAECRAVLASEGLLANKRGTSRVAAFVSVPSAELPADLIGKDGTLEDKYKYSRLPGQDFVDTKFVPLEVGITDREKFDRVIEGLPMVRQHLAQTNE